MTRAIFFDIGDTLVFDNPPLRNRFEAAALAAGVAVDPARLPFALRAVEAYALSIYPRITAEDPLALRECAEVLVTESGGGALTPSVLDALMAAFASQGFRRYVLPGVIELIEALKARGYIVGAISDWDPGLPDILDDLGLLAHLDVLSVSAIVGASKPDPRLFQDALMRSAVSPEHAVHVGDFLELDVAGARAAGMAAVLFDSKQRSPQADCPRFVSLADVGAYLLSLSG